MTTTYPAVRISPAEDPAFVDALRSACGGAVHVPGDPGYDNARQPWQVVVDQRPSVVVHPANADEVSAVIRLAAEYGVPVVPQGTGHNAGPLAPLEGAMLVRTGAMRDVEVDADARIARVGAGALWIDVVDAVAPYGLMALHGSSPDVGVAGYSLGGGMGWYARTLGLQTNNLTAIELVLADGTPVRASKDEHPELFWALRGGGGNFGVVTSLEMQLHPIETAYAGWLVWDWSQTERVLRRWAEWAIDAPDAVTTSFRVLQLPPIPEIPEPLRGKQIVAIDGAVLGDDALAEEILAPLRELEPEMDTFTRQPAAALVRLHGDPEGPTPFVSAGTILAELPEGGIQALVRTAGADSGSQLLLVELRQLGGALGRPHPGGGALSQMEGAFVAFAGGVPMDPASGAALTAQAEAVMSALSPWENGRQYGNFAESKVAPESIYGADTYRRLRAVRDSVDPHRLLVANHEI